MLLESPPLARAPGGHAAIAGEQRAFRQELAARLPSAEIGWRYRLVANGFSLSLPSSELPRLRTLPGVRDVLPAGSYAPQLSATPQQIGAPALWGQGLDTAGQGVKIGIIDSGIDAGHPFFDPTGYAMPAGFPKGQERFTTAKVIVARVFAPKSATAASARVAFSDDDSSHGTHVAGIAAGNADTPAGGGRRVSGVAPRAYLGNYKVFVETSSGLSPNANSPAIVAAIEAAVADGMDVINFSGGEPEIEPSRDIVARALDAAAAAGVVPVVAAGNDYNDFGAGSVSSPANSEASDRRRRRGDRRQPDDEHPRRVLVRRPDDDLAETEARRRRAWRRRALVGPGRRLVGSSRERAWPLRTSPEPRRFSASVIRPGPRSRSSPRSCSRVSTRSRRANRSAGPRFQGGGVVALVRADQPLLFARPTALSFGLLERGRTSHEGARTRGRRWWRRSVEGRGRDASQATWCPGRRPTDGKRARAAERRSVGGRARDSGRRRCIRRAPSRRRGQENPAVGSRLGVRARQASSRRRSSGQACTGAPRPRRPALVSRYRYPEAPSGIGVTTTLRGPERVFRFRIAKRVANAGVVITQQRVAAASSRAWWRRSTRTASPATPVCRSTAIRTWTTSTSPCSRRACSHRCRASTPSSSTARRAPARVRSRSATGSTT